MAVIVNAYTFDIMQTPIGKQISNTNITELELGVNYYQDSKTLTWIGPLDIASLTTFRLLYQDLPIDRLIIRSNGGKTQYGFLLGDYVKKYNITVEIAKQCDSACTLIALSANKLEGDGVLGFHLPYLDGIFSHAPDINSLEYIMAKERNNQMISDVLTFYKKSPYINDNLYDRIKNHSDEYTMIDVPLYKLLHNVTQ